MLKRIVTYLLCAAGLAAFVLYLRYCAILREKGSGSEVCTQMSVSVLDSADNALVNSGTVREMVCRLGDPIGAEITGEDINRMEKELAGMGAVLTAEVAIDRNGTLFIEVTQRHPVLRFQTRGHEGYYMDDTGFRFPLSGLFTADVPIVSGEGPEDDEGWMKGMLELGKYLDGHSFWHSQIEQIEATADGTLTLYTRTSPQPVRFGAPLDIESKMSRIFIYHKNIAPIYGRDHYASVDVRYSGQIVCTRAERSQK